MIKRFKLVDIDDVLEELFGDPDVEELRSQVEEAGTDEYGTVCVYGPRIVVPSLNISIRSGEIEGVDDGDTFSIIAVYDADIKTPDGYNEWYGEQNEYTTICYIAEQKNISRADMDNIECFIDTSEW